ncbi:MAG TPA: tripartite tricarboxylate transporter substrate binding protein [Burkholderiaceae bacterium]|nr:tripartite tricarboxylate transporter substrate binding protein [Burkholderiaceae bacterium]
MRTLGIAVVVAAAACSPAFGEDFSTGIVKLVVPYAAGGPVDQVARLLAAPLQNVLRQTVIVENKSGAGSALGARSVVAAPPDGRTILIGNVATLAIVPATMKAPGYDPVKSFLPLLQLAEGSGVMVTLPAFPANSVREFVAYAKANPGKLSYASAGVGNSAHLLGELVKSRAGVDVVHVPYRSGAEMSMAVVSGQVQFAFIDISAAMPLIRQGKVKALAVTGISRSPELPDVPTMVESGQRDAVLRNWIGAVVAAGTPPAAARRLESAIDQVIRSAEYQTAVRRMGSEIRPGTREDFAALIAADFEKWRDVAHMAGVSLSE